MTTDDKNYEKQRRETLERSEQTRELIKEMRMQRVTGTKLHLNLTQFIEQNQRKPDKQPRDEDAEEFTDTIKSLE